MYRYDCTTCTLNLRKRNKILFIQRGKLLSIWEILFKFIYIYEISYLEYRRIPYFKKTQNGTDPSGFKIFVLESIDPLWVMKKSVQDSFFVKLASQLGHSISPSIQFTEKKYFEFHCNCPDTLMSCSCSHVYRRFGIWNIQDIVLVHLTKRMIIKVKTS